MTTHLSTRLAAWRRWSSGLLVAALTACADGERHVSDRRPSADTSSSTPHTSVIARRLGVPFDSTGPLRELSLRATVFTERDQPVLLDWRRDAIVVLDDSARVVQRTMLPIHGGSGATVAQMLALGGDTVVVLDRNRHTLREAVGRVFTDTIVDLSLPFSREAFDRSLLGRFRNGHWVISEQISRVAAPERDGDVRVTVDTPVVFTTRGADIPQRIVTLPPVTRVMYRRGSSVHHLQTRVVNAIVSVCDSGVVVVSPREIVHYDHRGQLRRRASAPTSPELLRPAASTQRARDSVVDREVAGIPRPVPDTLRRLLHAVTDFSAQPLPPMLDRVGRLWYRIPQRRSARHLVYTLDGTHVGTVDGLSWAVAAGRALALSVDAPTEPRTPPSLTLYRIPWFQQITSGVGQCQREVRY